MLDVIQVTALATHAATYAAITTNPTPVDLNVHVGDGVPNSTLETTRHGLVIPLELTPLAASLGGSISPHELCKTFLQPHIGDPNFDPVFTWGRVVIACEAARDVSSAIVNTLQSSRLW